MKIELAPIDPEKVEFIGTYLSKSCEMYQQFLRSMFNQFMKSLSMPKDVLMGDTNYSSQRGTLPSNDVIYSMMFDVLDFDNAFIHADQIIRALSFLLKGQRHRSRNQRPISSRRMNTAKRMARRKMNRYRVRRQKS